MKRFSIIISVLFVISMMFIACSEEDATELRWDNQSIGAINDITWGDGDTEDAKWSKDGGYADLTKTEYKEVSVIDGTVACLLNTGGDTFVAVTPEIQETGLDTAHLEEGQSQTLTIIAAKK